MKAKQVNYEERREKIRHIFQKKNIVMKKQIHRENESEKKKPKSKA